MKTTALLNLNRKVHMPDSTDSLFCAIRRQPVAALPEERVRQQLLLRLTKQLGYPLQACILEKGLRQLPHLASKPTYQLPLRRTDLVVVAKDIHSIHPLYPLLLIECKAIPLTQKVLHQLIGYNMHIQAYFIATVNQEEEWLGFYDGQLKQYTFEKGLLPYATLLQKVHQASSK